MYSTLSKRAVVFTLKRCAMLYFSQCGGSGYEIILPDRSRTRTLLGGSKLIIKLAQLKSSQNLNIHLKVKKINKL